MNSLETSAWSTVLSSSVERISSSAYPHRDRPGTRLLIAYLEARSQIVHGRASRTNVIRAKVERFAEPGNCARYLLNTLLTLV
jgi:hypothetical protein